MQKFLTILIISLMTLSGTSAIASVSDFPVDTSLTCLPNAKLREMMTLNELRKIQEKELILQKERIAILDSIISKRDEVIANAVKIDSAYERSVTSLEQSISTLKQQIKTYETWTVELQSDIKEKSAELKKINRKLAFTKVFYGGVAIAAGILYITK